MGRQESSKRKLHAVNDWPARGAYGGTVDLVRRLLTQAMHRMTGCRRNHGASRNHVIYQVACAHAYLRSSSSLSQDEIRSSDDKSHN